MTLRKPVVHDRRRACRQLLRLKNPSVSFFPWHGGNLPVYLMTHARMQLLIYERKGLLGPCELLTNIHIL